MEKENTEKVENKYIDLLRYPVITLCIVAGLCLISKLVGIDFSQISKISPEGIEFHEKQAEAGARSMLQLTERITTLEEMLDQLPSALFDGVNSGPGGIDLAAADTVSQGLANMSYINADKDTYLKGKTGYILLGLYDEETETWQNQLPIRLTENKEIVVEKPERIPLRQYETTANIFLRPEMDVDSKALGALPRNLPILLLSVENSSRNQYWAKIEVEK